MASQFSGSRFASRTAFEALHVEEIESDDEEVVEQQPQQLPIPAPKSSSANNSKKKAVKDSKSGLQSDAQENDANKLAADASKTNINDGSTNSASLDSVNSVNGANNTKGHQSLPSAVVGKLGAQSNVVPTPPAPFAPQAPKQGTQAVQESSSSIKPSQPKFDQPESILTASKSAASAVVDRVPEVKIQAPQRLVQTEAQKLQQAQKQSSFSQQQSQDDAAASAKAKWKKIYERTLFTFIMIGGFIGLLLLGHPYMIVLVMVSQALVYREIVALFNIPGRPSVTGGGRSSRMSSAPTSAATSEVDEDEEDERIQKRLEGRREELWSKSLSWYFFAVANYFLYGESIIYYFKHIVFVDAYFIPFARHHRFLSFMLYVFGFMAFVSNLKRRNLKHQFGLFCWVHMSLLLIVFSSHFIVNNILEGLIWFFVPASLVICNDVFAYICGMTFGKTPLIDLSPKKTVEGFVGALVITEVFAYGWATLFQRFNYMICPAVSLGMNAFKEISCQANPVFHWHYLSLPPAIASLASSIVGHRVATLPWTAFQLHALVMAAFASLVAPFGGFFASGFKRAFNIKDFGDSIPGHGGLTDRFDCQFLMGLFSYVYYSSLIREHHVTVGSVLQTVVTQLTLEDQMELFDEISRYLAGQGKLTK
ncbi:related to CDS1 - CDP-diacylglycerol synthase [Melanopsichium pennsylvanicum]|uniref:Phosphatidate cytidylyltransferase n=2 Tax=Melanopsichium pennsylvanicum TaxID=63383 RepID=A0AAJ4XM49_9BASI|nr:related to exon1-CDP-diacylglycerol synthase [Melanopsichium pennsylvanicum 4]SNX83588.1 related to CDS1 - CDP-diacylglycerol synthase [Melanopsichium pennsylvanicum]